MVKLCATAWWVYKLWLKRQQCVFFMRISTVCFQVVQSPSQYHLTSVSLESICYDNSMHCYTDTNWKSKFLSHPITVYWHMIKQSLHWPFKTQCQKGQLLEYQFLSHWHNLITGGRSNPKICSQSKCIITRLSRHYWIRDSDTDNYNSVYHKLNYNYKALFAALVLCHMRYIL